MLKKICRSLFSLYTRLKTAVYTNSNQLSANHFLTDQVTDTDGAVY